MNSDASSGRSCLAQVQVAHVGSFLKVNNLLYVFSVGINLLGYYFLKVLIMIKKN